MSPFEIASLTANVVIGLGQIGIVWYGIREFERSNAARAEESARMAQYQEHRHAEAMTALKALIARTATAERCA